MLGFDVGGTELLVIAAVALIVVGPKDLPVLLRKLGQFVGKIRGMANEFRASFDEMARQSELDELRKEVQAMREGRYTDPMHDAAAQAGRADHVDQVFADIDASLNSGAVKVSPHDAYQSLTSTIEAPAPTVEIVAKAARKPRAAAKPKTEIVSKPKAKPAKGDLSVPTKPARKRVAKGPGSGNDAANSDITS
ncbi:preprotein translocase subunit TatB [Caulobacter sp. Root1455]|uniref:Sec-independent protein translocase protein TatB n=1 Tax=Caulobacter sp. Root1455 TaxID=1736465 RepID=UPI0006FF96D1|nr:Sec-independent protein translocase protein TatB [Caulobacter sp. Root1455]KQY92410.1 preprotein translocase subunit TatB [Caulobacter sp. Root1455]